MHYTAEVRATTTQTVLLVNHSLFQNADGHCAQVVWTNTSSSEHKCNPSLGQVHEPKVNTRKELRVHGWAAFHCEKAEHSRVCIAGT